MFYVFVDGLSIPFFSFGRTIQTRTLSLSATLTLRSDGPDWLLWVRRPTGPPREPPVNSSGIDVERDAGERQDTDVLRHESVPSDSCIMAVSEPTSSRPELPILTRRSARDNIKVLCRLCPYGCRSLTCLLTRTFVMP
jgi:hypothetical protein